MPTLVTIGINTPADGYNYYIGPCGGTLVAFPNNTTAANVIEVDLEDPIYGFVGGETTYCYQICTVELSNGDFDPGGGNSNEVCCCEGTGTLEDPIPTPDPEDTYYVGATSCCGVANNWEFILDTGSPAPQIGDVYMIYSTCYEVTSLSVTTGTPVQNPLQIPNGCSDRNCECSWQLLSCVDSSNGPIVSFNNTYIPNTGQGGDVYLVNEVCHYFAAAPSSNTPDIYITQSDVTSGGCDGCDSYTERIQVQSCKTNTIYDLEVTDLPSVDYISNNYTGFYIGQAAIVAGIPAGADCYRVLGQSSGSSYTISFNNVIQIADCFDDLCP